MMTNPTPAADASVAVLTLCVDRITESSTTVPEARQLYSIRGQSVAEYAMYLSE